MNPAIKIVLGVVIGGAVGGLLGYYGKCAGGTCPLTGNPYLGAAYGAAIGLLIALTAAK
jgi:hypothetical protein